MVRYVSRGVRYGGHPWQAGWPRGTRRAMWRPTRRRTTAYVRTGRTRSGRLYRRRTGRRLVGRRRW